MVTPDVSFGIGLEPRLDERVDQLLCQRRSDHAAAETQHVHIIMLDALVRGVGIVAQGGVNARDFVGGNAGSHTAATYDDAAFDGTVEDLLGYRA